MAKKTRKLLSLLLTCTMLLGMLGTAVFAADGEDTVEHPHNQLDCTAEGCTEGWLDCPNCEDGTVTCECGGADPECMLCNGAGTYPCTAEGCEDGKIDCPDCEGGKIPCTGAFGVTATTPPTCTEDGSDTYTCAICGATYDEPVASTGHTVGSWTVVQEATCTEAGEQTGTCTTCGDTVTEEIPAAGHQWGEAVDGVKTCTVCGEQEAALKEEGVTIIRADAEGLTYNIGEGQVVMLASPNGAADPIVFTDCTFNLTGETVKISGEQDGISYNGEVVTKLWIGGNVQFDNCTFLTDETGSKSTSAGYDACIYFYSGDIVLNNCTLSAENYNGQFLGLYGSSGSVTFNNSTISTEGNRNGWSYAMYGGSVLKLNGSTMTATGMSIESGNTNAFYSGDDKTVYDAIFLKDSTIDFSDNQAGGFALNKINIRVDHSDITVNNNSGNACNSGYWIVTNGSTITMNGNRGGHALSCIGFEMRDSTLEIMHNGYAGVYLQSRDSSLTNCTVDIRCNGEKLLSYSAGDLWLQGHTLAVDGGTSQASEGSPWLGAVGRTGSVTTTAGTTVVAYDLNSNAADNLKSNTSPTLTNAALALNGEENGHTLFLNPFMTTPYARGNAETSASNNDADLFKDDHVTSDEDIIAIANVKIGTLTDAQLAHHRYDWANGVVTRNAEDDNYGVMRYACLDCAGYMDNTNDHPNSFDCEGTYVYAPTVALSFDANTTDTVENMPETQQVVYETAGTAPTAEPSRSGYSFEGWYTDPSCETAYDFSTVLTSNVTVYAKWERQSSGGGSSDYYDVTVNYYDQDGNTIRSSYTTGDIREGRSWDVTDRQLDTITYNGVTYTFDRAEGDPLSGTNIREDKVVDLYYTAEGEDIPDPDTPTTDQPTDPTDPGTTDPTDPTDPTQPGGGTDLEDPDVPTAEVPETGDASLIWAAAALLSGIGLAWLVISGKKREENA